jgi:hypothetical protein
MLQRLAAASCVALVESKMAYSQLWWLLACIRLFDRNIFLQGGKDDHAALAHKVHSPTDNQRTS